MRLATPARRRPFVPARAAILAMLPFILALGPIDPGLAATASALARVLDEPAHPAWRADGTVAVWVHFDAPAPAPAALDRAEAALAPRAAARRGKSRAPGARLVDGRDLPLDPELLDAAAATGARPRQRSRWLRAASYDATADQVRALAALPGVRRVTLVGRALRTPPPPEATARPDAPRSAAKATSAWTLDYGASLNNLELINVPPVHELGYTGDGVLIAFLDTGFRLTHEALAHVPVVAAHDFAGDDDIVDTEPEDPADAHEHGTIVMSTVLAYAPGELVGVAPDAPVLLARAELVGASAPYEEDWWVAALEWAEAQGADLVTSSLGYWTFYTAAQLDGDTAASTVAADMAAARNLLVVNAAGNMGGTPDDVIAAPADGDSVLAVGATDPNGLAAFWSSSGPTADGRIKPDVTAQGGQVPVVDPNVDTAYMTAGGTSVSGPQVAGVAALMLQRAPFLTAEQVRVALRGSASHRAAPDNDYGWGIVDALAALRYWGPRCEHAPLTATEDTDGPYAVTARVTAPFGLASPLSVRYRVNGGAWSDAPLVAQVGDLFVADLPGVPHGSLVEYYLEAVDTQGQLNRFPWSAPAASYAFAVDADTDAPLIVHAPLGDQALNAWPPAVTATVTDNLAVDDVTMTCAVNGGPEAGPFTLTALPDDRYARAFPLDAAELAPGDVVSYTLRATDRAGAANTALAGPFELLVVGGGGEVLVLDDASGESATVAGWLTAAGYGATVRPAAFANAADFAGKQVAVLLAGDNGNPVASPTLRALLEDWVAEGRRLLVSGGEASWVSLILPGYPTFAADVLHAASFRGDDTSPLAAAAGQENHPLLTDPRSVALPLAFGATGELVSDTIVPTHDATLVLESTTTAGAGGALVHDDDTSAPGVQIVHLSFALSAIADQGAVEDLVVNAMTLLMRNGVPSGVGDGPGLPVAMPARLADVGPNPFNARVVVGLEVLRDGPVRLDVFDVRGRRLRSLLGPGTVLATGRRDIVWDGRDARGRDLGSGVYLLRLQAGASVQHAKLALIR